MRLKLERNIEYHSAMAEFHQGEVDAKAAKAGDTSGGGQMTASASPPQPDPDEKMAAIHKDTAAQLQALVDAEPLQPAIVTAQQSRPVFRNLSGDVKPSAGVFH
jgi:hypothetical protein